MLYFCVSNTNCRPRCASFGAALEAKSFRPDRTLGTDYNYRERVNGIGNGSRERIISHYSIETNVHSALRAVKTNTRCFFGRQAT